MKLYVANKNYSSWSMRPWVLLKNAGIAFEEVAVRFANESIGAEFKQQIAQVSPVGRVPVLTDGELSVWDSLAICEYLAEKFPEKTLWPQNAKARAHARSICAEMHSGFQALRSHCCMNIEAHLPEVGALKLRDEAGVKSDVARIEHMWETLLLQHGGAYLFGSQFGIADAYYAPVAMRFATYNLSQRPTILTYIQSLKNAPGVRDWIELALQEKLFLDFEEPYRLRP